MPKSPAARFAGTRSLWQRAVKAAQIIFPGYGGQATAWSQPGWAWPDSMPGSGTDWQSLAGDPWKNEVVSICLGWIGDNYCQPDFEVVHKVGANWEPVEKHPLTDLMLHPNPSYSASALWQAVVTSEATSGNAYLLKARAEEGWGRPLELWYLPHWQVIPQWDTAGKQFISHYIYRLPGQPDQILQVEDVIHFRRGLSLYNQRSGEAPLGPLARDLAGDNEGSSYTAAILANAGVFNVAISADGPNVIIPDDEAEKLQKSYSAKYGGDNRGRAMVCTRARKIMPMQWSPEDMALDKISARFEARLCAALRIPPMVVGLNVGDAQRTYANMAEAQQWAWEDCIKPLQARHCEVLNMFLLPDLGDPEKQHCRYCYDNVSALQEDENDKVDRAVKLFTGGLITRAQGLGIIGLESTPEDEVFLVTKGAELLPVEHAGSSMLAQQAEQKQQMQEQAHEQLMAGGAPESQGDAAASGQGALPAGQNGNGRGVPAKRAQVTP